MGNATPHAVTAQLLEDGIDRPKEREKKVLEALQADGHHWEAEYILEL